MRFTVPLFPACLALASIAISAPVPPWLDDPIPSTYQAPASQPIIIRHAIILTGSGDRMDDADIVIASGHIVAMGKDLAAPSGATDVDAHGRWITPGIIDVHSHNGTYSQPQTQLDLEESDVSELNDPNVADTTVETAVHTQDPAFSRALENGVTTLQILPGSSAIFGGRSVILKPVPATSVAAMKFPGAAPGFKMACGENPKGEEDNFQHRPTSRQGEFAYVRKALADAREYLNAWKASARSGRAAPKGDFKTETIAGIINGDIRLHMHCYRSDDMATYLALAHQFGFRIAAFHHAVEAYKIPQLLRESGTCAAVWGDWWGFKMEAQDAIRANAPLLDRAGVCVSMHSDSPASGQRLPTEAAKAAAAARPLGLEVPPERMIRWVTSTPAAMLGLQDRIGILASGRDADVVLWSGNPFSIYTKADLVIIDGAIRYDRAHPGPESVPDFELGREPSPHQ